jgi:hypothetical protein
MIAQSKAQPRVAPRPVFCVIEQAYGNRAVAEEVCAGRFTHISQTLDLGVEPDWLSSDLPADEEWRIEWSKFYYGLDLAQAFRETGDQKYRRTWELLVQSWIRQVPVGFDSSDVSARRVQNWIYAWNLFATSPDFTGFADRLEKQIIASITRQVNHLRAHLTPERNHRTLELYALFIVALALPEIDRQGRLLDFAIDELHGNLTTDIRADGVHRESSTHYHMTALRSFLGMRENARRFGLELPLGFDERLERACEFAMHCHRPDGIIPALSDSDTGSYVDLLKLAASIYSRPDFLYVAAAGTQGSKPRQRNNSFPNGGYYTQRSGWGDNKEAFCDERFLIFDCGPIGDGGHGHYDLLNVEIAAQGRPLIIDPGRYTYSEQAPNWRRWFKSTAAHNTVCVDGLDQITYRRGKPKGNLAQGKLIGRYSAPGFDLLCGEATSPNYEVVHTRCVCFIAGEYWIIADRLRGEAPHRFDLRFHLSPEAQDRVTIESQDRHLVAHTPELALVICGATKVKLEPGWYAPTYGTKLSAPVIRASIGEVAQADFFTLVVPLKTKQQTPTFQVRRNQIGFLQQVIFEISNSTPDESTMDVVTWNESDETYTLDSFHCQASAAWLRKSNKQKRLTACEVQGLSLSFNDQKPLFKSEHPVRWVTWDERTGVAQDDGRLL